MTNQPCTKNIREEDLLEALSRASRFLRDFTSLELNLFIPSELDIVNAEISGINYFRWDADYQSDNKDPDTFFIGLQLGGHIIGLSCLVLKENAQKEKYLYIDALERRTDEIGDSAKGLVSPAFCEAARQICLQTSLKAIFVGVIVSPTEAIYNKLGFAIRYNHGQGAFEAVHAVHIKEVLTGKLFAGKLKNLMKHGFGKAFG